MSTFLLLWHPRGVPPVVEVDYLLEVVGSAGRWDPEVVGVRYDVGIDAGRWTEMDALSRWTTNEAGRMTDGELG